MLETVELTCPYCWENFESTVDCSAGAQDYVEDCAVCCHPIRVRTTVTGDGRLETIDCDRENA